MSQGIGMIRESRVLGGGPLNNFTHSIDIKKFSRDHRNMTPSSHQHSNSFFRNRQRSHDKIRRSQPAVLGIKFTKNLSQHSQKNMHPRRKISSGFQVAKSHHHSLSIDQHMVGQKYSYCRELFQSEKWQQLVSVARQIVAHLEEGTQQKNVYYWLAVGMAQRGRIDNAIEELGQCLHYYPLFQEGHLMLAQLLFKKKQYNQAQKGYMSAIKCDPTLNLAYKQLAQLYIACKQFQEASQLLSGSIERFRGDTEMLSLLIESLLALGKQNEAQQKMKEWTNIDNPRDSCLLYSRGLLQFDCGNQDEAYILFDEALKFNSHKDTVRKALLETIKIEIERRDFYKAYHSIGRIVYLDIQETEELKVYRIFVEGVMTMMKKKSEEALNILSTIASNQICQQLRIDSLILKYQGYGYFKLSKFSECIKAYSRVPAAEKDESSTYNQLLAEGIVLSDSQNDFKGAIGKFEQAKEVYPLKVQPYIYIAMTTILKANLWTKEQAGKAEAYIDALKQLARGNDLNPNSSNLLYHRTILHLFFEDWEQAHFDINKCIEKAEQNLPKYFYLRGVCYFCIKEYKKAINQYSICLSLDSYYAQAYLQKAKSYFLLGATQKGFSNLKLFMEMKPQDNSIYQWIGDLLYEGTSYSDAIKAYAQLKASSQDYDLNVMKAKCLMRTATLQEIAEQLKLLERVTGGDKDLVQVDQCAFRLLGALVRGETGKQLVALVKKMNHYLELNMVGNVFQLIDCMNLLGIASFYLQNYTDAYESFILVLQLFQSLSEKSPAPIKTQQRKEGIDLSIEQTYFNIMVCQLAQGNIKQSLKMLKEEFVEIVGDQRKKKQVERLVRMVQKDQPDNIQWQFRTNKPFNCKFKRVDIKVSRVKLKTKPSFSLYHDSLSHLYHSQVAQEMMKNIHAGYIDNMPEGPWIKRNPHGVVFTQEMLPTDNSITFEDSARSNSQAAAEEEEEEGNLSKKEQFLKHIRMDQTVQAKLNKHIQKEQVAGMRKNKNDPL